MKSIDIIIFVSIFAGISGAQIDTDFELDSLNNWHSEGDGRYYLEANTGNPGNCMRIDDDATGATNLAIAPVMYLGNWSAADTTDSLTADVFVSLINGTLTSNLWAFRISGPGGSATSPGITPVLNEWTHVAVSLDSAQWNLTAGTWQELLAHVSHFEVRAEYVNGDEFVRLDNIGLTISPVIVPIIPPVLSDFEKGSYEGWSFEQVGGTSIPTSGGNPGRYVRITDGTGVSQALAPPKFLGDWRGIDEKAAVQFDLQITSFSGTLYQHGFWLQISGPGGAALIPVDSTVTDAFNRWKTFSFMISEAEWSMQSGNWMALIADVRELRLVVEFINGSEIVSMDNFRISDAPPEADFIAGPVYQFYGEDLIVQFTDRSLNAPDSWSWDFGDGDGSTEPNPVHLFQDPGKYDISLSVTNRFGNDFIGKPAYIEVAGITDSILFADDFDDNDIHPGWRFRNGTWVEQNQMMVQNSNYYNGSYIGGCYALVGSPLWKNYQMTVDFLSSDNDKIGVVFNYRDADNFYLFTWQQEGPHRALKRFVGGVMNDLVTDTVGYVTNQWYHLALITQDGQISVKIDSVEVFSVTDTTFKAGRAGLYCHGNQSSFWDNFEIRNLDFVNAISEYEAASPAMYYHLYQNYPNPFNPVTTVSWRLPVSSHVELAVYNNLGELTGILLSQNMGPGRHSLRIDGRNLASGIYYYVLRAGAYQAIKKMVLLK